MPSESKRAGGGGVPSHDARAAAANAGTERFDVDPANPERRVPHKRVNNAYLVHQRWLQQQATKEDKRRNAHGAETSDVGDIICSVFLTALAALAVALLAGQFVHGDLLWGYRGKWTNWRARIPRKLFEFTPEHLAQFKGEDGGRIFLAVKGTVFDVSDGRSFYGPGGSYHIFAGRDASRAFVTGCFATHLTHDTRGFSDAEKQMLDGWYDFYANHPAYYPVGTVRFPPISEDAPIPEPCRSAVGQKPGAR